MRREKSMLVEQTDKKGKITAKVGVQDAGNYKEIYLTSKYDAVKEAEEFAEHHASKLKDINLLYGLGLGYHVRQLQKILGDRRLIVFENRMDIYRFAEERGLYREIRQSNQIELICSEKEEDLLQEIRKLLREGVYFFTYTPSVYAIHGEFSPNLKYILESLKLTASAKKEVLLQLKENAVKNAQLNDLPAEHFWGQFVNKPALLVSAGPSLKNTLPYLSEPRDKYLIFTVGRAFRTLMNHGIIPDFVALIDGDDLTYEQFRGVEESNVPLFYLNTASHLTVSKYRGPRYIFYNSKGEHTESDSIVETEGSVATAVFSLLIRFGCNPIIFAGQDLGYLDGQSHHSEVYYKEEEKNIIHQSFRKTKDVFGNYIDTNLGFLRWKRWFEQQIGKYPEIQFYNVSKGADIAGAKPIREEELGDLI